MRVLLRGCRGHLRLCVTCRGKGSLGGEQNAGCRVRPNFIFINGKQFVVGPFARSFVGLPWELGSGCVVDPFKTTTEACFRLHFFLFSGVPV